jgi:hypothetical protein
MSDILVTKITDENRDALKWLALAQMLDGRSCAFCGFTWNSRKSVIEREPIAASQGGNNVACKPCWDAGKRLP